MHSFGKIHRHKYFLVVLAQAVLARRGTMLCEVLYYTVNVRSF